MFDLPQDINDAAKGSLNGTNGGVPLPFPAPEMWWKNGEAALGSLKEITDARRFGGWGISKEGLDNLPGPIQPVPADSVLFELTNSESKIYEAFLTRQAWVAPIARRYAWFEYNGKSASRVNYLCFLGMFKKGEPIQPWGAVVLSAKSYAGIDLDNAFKTFATKTASLRKSTAHNFFYIPLGTWGPEVKYATRSSKKGDTSSVTPVQLYEPKDGWTAETLQTMFVGADVAKQMMELKNEASAWLDDWNKRNNKSESVDPNAALEAAEQSTPFD